MKNRYKRIINEKLDLEKDLELNATNDELGELKFRSKIIGKYYGSDWMVARKKQIMYYYFFTHYSYSSRRESLIRLLKNYTNAEEILKTKLFNKYKLEVTNKLATIYEKEI